MLSVYDAQARDLVRKFGNHVLVRDLQPAAQGLEVPQYHGYFLSNGIHCASYVPVRCAGLEMLYTRSGADVPVCQIVSLLLPKEFPKTYAFLLETLGSEYEIGRRMSAGLNDLSRKRDLIEKTAPGRFVILEEARKKSIIQVVAQTF